MTPRRGGGHLEGMQASDEALPELGERQRSVLLAVIEEHVATAEPVASASVARKRSVGVSAATARSVMASQGMTPRNATTAMSGMLDQKR